MSRLKLMDRKLIWSWILFSVAALAVLAASCHRRAGSPNVLLVIIDTLPAGHSSAYGYERQTTPTLEALAKEGVRFEHAISAAPWTLPALASILTGTLPSRHQAGMHLDPWTLDDRRLATMSQNLVTLAEVFRQKGYATAGFFENPFAHPGYGLGRGFEVYDYAPGDNLTIRRADMVTAAATRWLLTRERKNQPFFLVVHYFDPHLAYDPPPQFMATYAYGYKGRLIPPYNPDPAELKKLKFGELKPSLEDREFIRGLYDAEVAFTDSQVGAFFEFLRREGLYDPTLVAVTADHGEEFWEHGGFEHGHTLYRELIEVPLILKFPQGKWAGAVVKERVSMMDLFPTVMEYLGWPVPFAVDGRSFLSTSDTQFQFPPRVSIISENLHYGPEKQSIYCGPYQLIINRVTGRLELYHADTDPGETQDILGQRETLPAVCKEQVVGVAKTLEELEKEPAREYPPDPETKAKLRALGYIK